MNSVFNNPFEKITTCTFIKLIWFISMVFSIPFVVTTDFSYLDNQNLSVICRNMTNDNYGGIPFFNDIMANRLIVSSYRLMSLLIEFVIPTLVVIYFTYKIIIRLFDLYVISTQRVRSTAGAKRLISILFIFIMKNTVFVLLSGRWTQLFNDYLIACPTSVSSGTVWFFFYEISRITTTVNSFIYFWMNSEFMKMCKMVIYKCATFECSETSNSNIVQF